MSTFTLHASAAVSDFTPCALLFVCQYSVNVCMAEARTSFHTTVQSDLCQPCPGHVQHHRSCNDVTSGDVEQQRALVVKLKRDLRNSRDDIREQNTILRTHMPDDFVPWIINPLRNMEERTTRHMRGHPSRLLHRDYSAVVLLMAYMNLTEEIFVHTLPAYTHNIADIEQRLRITLCRLHDFIALIGVRSIPDRVCAQSRDTGILNTRTDSIDYVVTVLGYAERIINNVVNHMTTLSGTIDTCQSMCRGSRVHLECPGRVAREFREDDEDEIDEKKKEEKANKKVRRKKRNNRKSRRGKNRRNKNRKGGRKNKNNKNKRKRKDRKNKKNKDRKNRRNKDRKNRRNKDRKNKQNRRKNSATKRTKTLVDKIE